MKQGVFGTLMAGAVSAMMLTSVAQANEPAAASGAEATHKCQNNSCKGKAECKGFGNNACKGQNACKGHGMLGATDKAACKKQGGKWVVEKKA
jgi:hypothetical protein